MNFAIIPVKKKSERVKDKNFRKFYKEKSIFDIKIEQLIKAKQVNKIIISSNNLKLSDYEKVNNKIIFIKRNNKFCNNTIPWSEMIYHIISSNRINENDIIIWSHTTSPLFSKFDKAINTFRKMEKKGYDSLIGVQKFNGFLLDNKSRPINYNWGVWHKYSQFLDKYFLVNGAVFIGRKKTFVKTKYISGINPFKFLCSDIESIDLDTELDFSFAQFNYKKLNDKS